MSPTQPPTERQPEQDIITLATRVEKTKSAAAIPFRVRKHRDGLLNPRPRGYYIESTKRNSRESPFLLLPPEIRNRIYHLVFAKHFDIIPIQLPICRLGSMGKPEVKLLQTCRQIYYEAALLPFKLNSFHVLQNSAMDLFIKRLARGQRLAIKTLTLSLEVAHWFWWQPKAKRFEELQKIIVWYMPTESADFEALTGRLRTGVKKSDLEVVFKMSKPVPRVTRKLTRAQFRKLKSWWLSERMVSRTVSH